MEGGPECRRTIEPKFRLEPKWLRLVVVVVVVVVVGVIMIIIKYDTKACTSQALMSPDVKACSNPPSLHEEWIALTMKGGIEHNQRMLDETN